MEEASRQTSIIYRFNGQLLKFGCGFWVFAGFYTFKKINVFGANLVFSNFRCVERLGLNICELLVKMMQNIREFVE